MKIYFSRITKNLKQCKIVTSLVSKKKRNHGSKAESQGHLAMRSISKKINQLSIFEIACEQDLK